MHDLHDRTEDLTTVQKLVGAIKHFNRVAWHHEPIMGCKPSEIQLLFCIKRGLMRSDTPMKVSEISKFMHVTSPTVTQLINGLEANGLVERHIDPTDRRAVRVQLTPRGELVNEKAREAFLASFNGLIDYLGEERSNQLAELLSDSVVYFTEREANLHQSQWSGDETL
jgi:DNA-binding MarR family transcriptional regulator